MILSLSSESVEGGSRVSCMKNRTIPQEGVCLFCCGCSCAYSVFIVITEEILLFVNK